MPKKYQSLYSRRYANFSFLSSVIKLSRISLDSFSYPSLCREDLLIQLLIHAS